MATCKVCSEQLVSQVDDEEAPVPDDLELPCGCHYHWQCLLDQSSYVALNLKCPSCERFLPVNQAGPSVTNTPQSQAILTRYTTEDGVEENYDILPIVTEEAYLESHPGERRARAFHVMLSQDDVLGVLELLNDAASEGDDVSALVFYRDALNKNKNGLHLAIEKGQEEAVWLMLYLGSPLPLDMFPQEAAHAAQSMGVERLDGRENICCLRDDQNLTAEDYARNLGDKWSRLLQGGVLRC